MAHGYYNLAGEFVETATLEAATAAWRSERGYSTGGSPATTTSVATIDRSAEVTARPGVSSPAANLANAFTAPGQPDPRYAHPPTAPTYTHEGARLSQYDRTNENQELANTLAGRYPTTTPAAPTIFDQPVRLQYTLGGSALQNRYQDERRYTIPQFGEQPEPKGRLEKILDVLHPMGERGPASAYDAQFPEPGQQGQYQSRQYYQGGSEQAYLGPVAQAEEYFFGTGDRWGLGSAYIDIAPEDRRPPPVLSQSTVRILTKSGPSYLEGVDYGPKMTMEDIERIYEYDPVTGHYLLKGAEPVPDYYFTSSGQGYASAGPGYGTGYGYGSRGGQVGGGLVNWRIG